MANLFPVGELQEDYNDDRGENIAFGRSWCFDYEAGEFVVTPTGKVSSCEGKDAWLEWCKKALQTERYRHLIYSRSYGQEFNELIRSGLPRSAIEMEIQRITTETLENDPRTGSVDSFTYKWLDDSCYFTCVISNIHEETIELQGRVVNS